MLGIFVGRVPIYDRQLEVAGYEVLLHKYKTDHSEYIDDDLTTSQVILNTFMEIGLHRIVGDGLAFIKLSRNFILEKYPLKLLHDLIVLEVHENMKLDDELIEALRFLSKQDFQIALDDVIDLDEVKHLIDIINIVKLDFATLGQSRLEEIIPNLRQYKNIKLLAENIETLDDFDICTRLGFDYYQGFFLCQPNIVSEHRMPASRTNTLRLLAKLHEPKIEFRDLEKIIRGDVSLSYRLLRLINSAFYARPKNIKSIHHALTLLGLRRVQDWVSMLLLSNIEEKPRELVYTAMERAKMCEILSIALKKQKFEMGFLVGMFSVLDALLDMPLEKILLSLPLGKEITSAILYHKGFLGSILHCVLAYERGEWEEATLSGIDPETIRNAYLESLDWATAIGSLV